MSLLSKLSLIGILIIIIFYPNNIWAQNKITIIKSDKLRSEQVDGETIRKLIGNVELSSGRKKLSCDSALYYVEKEMVYAYGNIIVETESEKIWADTLIFYNKSEISEFKGRVVVHQDTLKLYGSDIRYAFETKIVYLPARFLMEDEKGMLVADFGIYFSDIDSASFRGNIQLMDSLKYIEADSLNTNREKDLFELKGHTFIKDNEENVIISGDYVFTDSTGYRFISGKSNLLQFDPESQDTSYMLAQIITHIPEGKYYKTVADSNVIIWSKDFSSRSLFAVYQDSLEQFLLTHQAKAWHKQIQLSAENILITMLDDTVRSLSAWPQPFAVSQDSTTGRLNQMKSDSIFASFISGDLKTLDLYKNAQLLYFIKDEDEKNDGAMELIANKLRIYFEDGDASDFKAWQAIKSYFKEEIPGIELTQLSGIIWTPEIKPNHPQTPKPRFLEINLEELKKVPKHYPSKNNLVH